MNMRAKMTVSNVQLLANTAGQTIQENLTFNAVAKSGIYPADGSDEDNSYARWSPSAEFKITVANPALFGKFERGQKYYVDFTPAVAPSGLDAPCGT